MNSMRRIGCTSKAITVYFLVSLVWSIAAEAQTQPQFLQTLPFPGNTLAVADFNGDGTLDTIGTNAVLFRQWQWHFHDRAEPNPPGPPDRYG